MTLDPSILSKTNTLTTSHNTLRLRENKPLNISLNIFD